MILLSTLSVIRHLICSNNQNWLLTFNLIYETLNRGRKGFVDFNTVSKIFVILHKRPYIPPSFSRKISTLHRRSSQKHSFFTTFSLVLRMGQVFNITNKYQFPNQSTKTYTFTQEIYISPLHISIQAYLGPSQTSKVGLSAKIL